MDLFPSIIMAVCQRYSQLVLVVKAQTHSWICWTRCVFARSGIYANGAQAHMCHFTVAIIWPPHWARGMNTTQNLHQQRIFLPAIKKVASPGLTTNACIANCWPHATRPRGLHLVPLTAFAYYAQKNPPYNATAAWRPNTSPPNSPTLKSCICKYTNFVFKDMLFMTTKKNQMRFSTT